LPSVYESTVSAPFHVAWAPSILLQLTQPRNAWKIRVKRQSVVDTTPAHTDIRASYFLWLDGIKPYARTKEKTQMVFRNGRENMHFRIARIALMKPLL